MHERPLIQRVTQRLAYFTFDLLHLDGHDLRACPIEDRKDREPGGRRTNDALE